MKIVSLLGSPRPNSNSSAIANQFLKTAQELGAETTCFTLNRLNYRGCQGCYVCKTTLDHCVLRDDLAQVLDAVAEADLVVLASPVYYGEVTSQLKGFLDRTFSYLVPDYRTSATPTRLSPKKLVFVQTQGHPDEEMFGDIFQRYEHFLKWMGFTEATLIRACGIGPGSVDAPPEEALREAEAVARRLVS